MTKQSKRIESSFGERLDFSIRLAALRKGFDSASELAAAIGKSNTQISQWKKRKPKIDAIRLVAKAAGVDAMWLDNPDGEGTVEPEVFADWLAGRRARLATKQARKAAQRGG